MEITIHPARTSDAAQLTHISQSAKAHWPYSEALLKSWEAELTITVDHIISHRVFVATAGAEIIGFYSLFPTDQSQMKLENLFVLPEFMGKGAGKKLLLHALESCRRAGCQAIWLESDPHAEAFYLHHGFTTVGQLASSVPHRYLPVMRLSFTD